jgi:carbamoyl-phosphate synthase large subunit
MKKSITVMVTGIGGGGHGEQILKALKMSEKQYTIVGGDMSSHSKGLMEVDHPYLLPPASHQEYISAVLAVCKKHEVKALFHGSEPELKKMSQHRKEIENEGVFLPINPQSVLDLCMDKNQTQKFLLKNGFCAPKSLQINSEKELEQIDFFPVVLKPSIGGGGSANILLAQTPEEIHMFGKYLLAIYDEFIVQEYIGTPECEFTVGVLASMDGEIINSIAVNRTIMSSLSNLVKVPNRTKKSWLGKTLAISSGVSQGEIGRFHEVTQPCEKIAATLGCRGAVNIQCRYVDGQIFVFEINPRFSGTTSLRAMVGYNEPDLLIRKHILGEEIQPNFPYQNGHIMRGLEESFVGNTNFTQAKNLL